MKKVTSIFSIETIVLAVFIMLVVIRFFELNG